MSLDARVPEGPLERKWSTFRATCRLVHPSNKGRYHVLVVGSGLAGASAAASLAELGYRVTCFCFQDSPRRAHSVAAQGGINASKNYRNDGDDTHRLFLDTMRGGDYRSREANVHRLAELSTNIIDQAVAQGVPFAREYGGMLANRSFGGVQVERTFYARGQTGQQLLLGAYAALSRQVRAGRVAMLPRREVLDVVVVDGRARGVIARELTTGALERHAGHAVVLATGGYATIYALSTLALGCNATAVWRAHLRGAAFANPSFVQVHPTCIPPEGPHQSKLTLMSESLRNDGRLWVPTLARDQRAPEDVPEDERDYYLEREYPAYGNLTPRDVASRAAKRVCDRGHGVGAEGNAVYLDFRDAVARLGVPTLRSRYGNLFDMYRRITGEDPCRTPMRIAPAAHFTMGGLWVDYHLMTTIPGLFALGECNFADHGANRLGANSLLQACVDGYFVAPYTVGDYLAGPDAADDVDAGAAAFDPAQAATADRIRRIRGVGGRRPPRDFHRELGRVLWDACGIARRREGLEAATRAIADLRASFWADVSVPGLDDAVNPELERALRVADFLELGELMCRDALAREESCGAHHREEHVHPDGEPRRDDARFAHVAAWLPGTGGAAPYLVREPLSFEAVDPGTRSYR